MAQTGTRSAPKKAAAKKKQSKRRTTAPNGDKGDIRRDENGRIRESDDKERPLSQDKKRAAKKTVLSGQGGKGDLAVKTQGRKK